MDDPLFPLLLALRYLHILGAITLMGGTIFMRFALAPTVAGFDGGTKATLHEQVRSRWAKFVMLSALLLLTARGTVEGFYIPRGVILIDWAFAILFLAAARASVRLAREGLLDVRRPLWTKRKPAVLVLGAGDSAEMLLRDIFAVPDTDLEVVGLLDDDPRKHGHQIHRVEKNEVAMGTQPATANPPGPAGEAGDTAAQPPTGENTFDYTPVADLKIGEHQIYRKAGVDEAFTDNIFLLAEGADASTGTSSSTSDPSTAAPSAGDTASSGETAPGAPAAPMIAVKLSAARLAPPTRAPPTSATPSNSAAFLALTEPP